MKFDPKRLKQSKFLEREPENRRGAIVPRRVRYRSQPPQPPLILTTGFSNFTLGVNLGIGVFQGSGSAAA